MPPLLSKHGARVLANGQRVGFPPRGTVGMFLVEEMAGDDTAEVVPYVAYPDGTQQRVSDVIGGPAFFTTQRAQGIHWVTDPTYGTLAAAVAGAPAGAKVVVSEPITVTATVTIDKPLTLVFHENAYIIPDLPADHPTGRVLLITSSGVRLELPRFDGSSLSGTPTLNRYLIRVTGTAEAPLERVEIVRPRFDDCEVTDGALLVTHGIYAEYTDGLLISNGECDSISGSFAFLNHCTKPMVVFNRVKDTGWYSIHYGNGCLGGDIGFNKISGWRSGGRNWGGSIDIMSQHNPPGPRNERVKVHHNEISGEHNYGSCIRLMSVSYTDVYENHFTDCTEGDALEILTMIRVTSRGDTTSHTHNGPFKDVRIYGNVGIAAFPKCIGVYADNPDYGYASGIDTADGLVIHDNRWWSVDATKYFQAAATIHGQQGGITGFSVRGNRGTFIPQASPVPGAIGLIALGASRPVADGFIGGNQLRYLGTATNSSEAGIYIGQYADRIMSEPNVLDGFWHQVRTAANAGTDLRNLSEQSFRNTASADVVYNVAPKSNRMHLRAGTTAARPTVSDKGTFYFDTDVSAPLFWDAGTRWLDGAGQEVAQRDFVNGDTTPSVSGRARVYVCANTGPTNITTFDDGIVTQRVTVRGDANTTMVHGSGLILKGKTNVTFADTFGVIEFVRISNSWYETNRNF